ncbi:MAG: hypothetical protein V4480_00275 [Patescibacteria group bacterium]
MTDKGTITNQHCGCGLVLYIRAAREPLRGIHGRYEIGEGRTMFAAVNCTRCGRVYDPDADVYASYFNMVAERLFQGSG